MITPRGEKKAYVILSKEHDALEVANKIGIMWTLLKLLHSKLEIKWIEVAVKVISLLTRSYIKTL